MAWGSPSLLLPPQLLADRITKQKPGEAGPPQCPQLALLNPRSPGLAYFLPLLPAHTGPRTGKSLPGRSCVTRVCHMPGAEPLPASNFPVLSGLTSYPSSEPFSFVSGGKRALEFF